MAAKTAEYAHAYYLTYRDKHREIAKRRIAVNKALVLEYRSKPCVDCLCYYPAECMEFDHILEDKTNRPVGALVNTQSLATLQREIDKCEVVCANCHALRTHDRGQNKRGGYSNRGDSK